MKKAQFLTPVVTAFDENANLDVKGNQAIYEHLIQGGIDGIVVMGSTGEFFAMSMEQKKQLIDIAVSYINHRVKCFVGTGCMTVQETVELSNYAAKAGADAVMIISPYYFSMNPGDIEKWYGDIASQVNSDIYIYNFPDRTGHDISPEVTLRLLRQHKNIVGYKDTVEALGHTRALIELTKADFPDFVMLSGYDENLAHVLLSGGNGCIGGLSNLAPETFSAWVKAINEQDLCKIEEYQRKVNALMELYTINTPFIPVMKKAMILRGVPIQEKCIEFSPITAEQTAKVTAIMKKANLL
ncbi:4-hydroxy-tetrahydrodipicolinate synthase [Sporomusaceae bacterium BoRhaA]|uniref:dihydrodipicolinate synthase family protein n=1 Tax=Pelorhabdus rhamnosifermentans TaxID=2772457 RepID=UPI001C06470F|nr:dihydrodipicolinate synthase family protein [Pelorhabdus rhamnosifermentans]MBU2703412.1 4-hydroxy-tetrahydrodipicolinate synthase [Pelorhabdus rhamnosifermentans]